MDEFKVYEIPKWSPTDDLCNTDQWIDVVEDIKLTVDGARYKPFAKTKIVRMTDRELTAIVNKMPTMYKSLKTHVNKLLRNPMFFKLSTRSPKDAWAVLAPDLGILPIDSKELQLHKLNAQMELLKVKTFDDVLKLIYASERLKDDIRTYFDDHTLCPTLVFQEWRQSTGTEYRSFIKNKTMIGLIAYPVIGPVDPDDHRKIKYVVEHVAKKLPMANVVIDVYVDALVYVIELNPFSDVTDPGSLGSEIYFD
jgi:hypothetical protein